MIVQAIGLLDDLDKELNTYAMRVREWYGWHFPEMTRIVTDNITYAKTVSHQHCTHLCLNQLSIAPTESLTFVCIRGAIRQAGLHASKPTSRSFALASGKHHVPLASQAESSCTNQGRILLRAGVQPYAGPCMKPAERVTSCVI